MIALVRCDDRLIHGQCVVRVIKDFSIDRVVVADDFVAGNPTLRMICELAVPTGVTALVATVDEAAENASKYSSSPERVLLLMKSPETALRLYTANDSLPKELNIGPMSSRKDTEKLAFYCHMTAQERLAAQKLSEMGVRVYLNQVTDQPVIEWADLK